MADMHIDLFSGDATGAGTLLIHYHVPVLVSIRQDVLDALGPMTPQAPGMEQDEIDDFAAGELWEVQKTFGINFADAGEPSATSARARAAWQAVATDTHNWLKWRTKYYGTTLAKA